VKKATGNSKKFGLRKKYMIKTLRNRFLNFYSDNLKSKIENLKWLGLFAIVVALTVCGGRAEAQQAGKVPRIGFLDGSTAPAARPSWRRFGKS